MILSSPRHKTGDLASWTRYVALDRRIGGSVLAARKAADAARAVADFASAGPCYAGVSWGKDSVVVAHLVRAAAPEVPLIWVRVEGRENPDCVAVRDAFLSAWPGPYHEINAVAGKDLTSGQGFAVASCRFGDRYISGVRGQESRDRAMRMRAFGVTSSRTCAPVGWWGIQDVFGYLEHHGLPVHPVYAMTFGGSLRREELRVASLGGHRGTGRGRAEWERAYFGRGDEK